MLTLINMLPLFLVVGGAHGSHCGCVEQHWLAALLELLDTEELVSILNPITL